VLGLARKLAVVMHRMRVSGEVFQPFRETSEIAA
jgi:hypothetical protein